jgi:hypothetical protein
MLVCACEVSVCARARACVRARVCASVCVRVCAQEWHHSIKFEGDEAVSQAELSLFQVQPPIIRTSMTVATDVN